jgi:hypothetical protein
MSKLLHTTRCPRCASRGADRKGNNLAVYDDGHEYCFACGYLKAATAADKYFAEKHKAVEENKSFFTNCGVMNPTGMSWLKQYGLTNEEVQSNFFWDDRGYCVFEGGMFQNARNFKGQGAKYITKGKVKGNEVVFKSDIGATEERLLSSIVIVEDAISAIKVSRVCSAVAIHNAVIPIELILRLSKQFKNVFIWLDNDKSKEMIAEARKASPYFDSVKIVFSELDPKCYSANQIKEYLIEK